MKFSLDAKVTGFIGGIEVGLEDQYGGRVWLVPMPTKTDFRGINFADPDLDIHPN